MDGREKCRVLNEMRAEIAEANGFPYRPRPCRFRGECFGRCRQTEDEVNYLNARLMQKSERGETVMLGLLARHDAIYYAEDEEEAEELLAEEMDRPSGAVVSYRRERPMPSPQRPMSRPQESFQAYEEAEAAEEETDEPTRIMPRIPHSDLRGAFAENGKQEPETFVPERKAEAPQRPQGSILEEERTRARAMFETEDVFDGASVAPQWFGLDIDLTKDTDFLPQLKGKNVRTAHDEVSRDTIFSDEEIEWLRRKLK